MLSVIAKNSVLLETFSCFVKNRLTLLDNQQYAYTVISKKDPLDVLIVSSYPDEWVELYQRNNFQLTDPVILKAIRQSSPFAWDENITLLSDLKFTKIFTLSQKYNVTNGYTFILHDHYNNLSILSIIMSQNNANIMEAKLIDNSGIIQMLLIEINSQMYKLIESKRPDFLNEKGKRKKAIFTTRENEILYWASMGKTYQEIAIIAGISVSTVKFHMGNAVKKLQVSNARQAIRLGVELDLIKPATSAAR